MNITSKVEFQLFKLINYLAGYHKMSLATTLTDTDATLVQLSNGNLQINELQKSDEGIYQCTATNYLGSASSFGKLRIVGKPEFCLQALNISICL